MSKPVSDLEHIESLFSDLPNYVFYKDDHCVYRLCNQAFAQFAGFQSVQEVIGKTDFDMPWERQHAELYQQEDVWIMQTGESIIEREVPMRIAHEDRILLISKRGVKNASHHIMGILGIYIDITDRKAAETLRIHNTKLLYRLAQQIGHDLRSPLTALGMMLARQAIPDAQKENMQQCLEQMNVLTSHLLKDFSVPQAPQETYFPILIAVQHILQQKHHQYDPKKIAWRFETDLEQTAFLFLHGNALSFQRMCGNLINNSVDALDGHSGVVTLRLEANQKHIRLQIQDTGKGIEPEVLEKIQNRIQVTSGKIEGHGIGMGQIQDTLMGFQGTMDISSEVGTGTAVTLTLPKAAPPALITQLVLHPRDVLCLIGSDASSESIMRKKLEENPETLRVFSDVKSAQKELNDTSIHHILLVDDIKNEPVPEKTEHCTPYRLVSRDAILPMTPYLLKSLLLYVPVTWVQETQNSHYDHIELVILENSIPLVTALKYVLRNHHREAQTDFYDNTLDFLTAYTHYTKTTRFCIDYNLPSAKNGIDIIQILHRSGYRNLYLCTGLEVSDLNMQMLEGVRIISKGDWKKLEKVILGQ